jgi:hypothetical protein
MGTICSQMNVNHHKPPRYLLFSIEIFCASASLQDKQ